MATYWQTSGVIAESLTLLRCFLVTLHCMPVLGCVTAPPGVLHACQIADVAAPCLTSCVVCFQIRVYPLHGLRGGEDDAAGAVSAAFIHRLPSKMSSIAWCPFDEVCTCSVPLPCRNLAWTAHVPHAKTVLS